MLQGFGASRHPYPSITIGSMKRMTKKVSNWLSDWQPQIIICHTIWPVAELANRLAKQMGIPWIAVVHGHDFDVGLQDSNIGQHISRLAKQATKSLQQKRSQKWLRMNNHRLLCN